REEALVVERGPEAQKADDRREDDHREPQIPTLFHGDPAASTVRWQGYFFSFVAGGESRPAMRDLRMLILVFSAMRSWTSRSSMPTISPRMPESVRTTSPFLRAPSIASCSFCRFCWGRIMRKYITRKKIPIVMRKLMSPPPQPG